MRILKCIAALSITVHLFGCMQALRMPEQSLLGEQRILEVLNSQKTMRPRLSGRFRAKGTGIKQFLGSVDIVFAAQTPASFYVSIPSFFGNPARIISCDGEKIYLLDLSGQNPEYLVEPSTDTVLQDWLGLPIEPKALVDALLGVVDLQNASLLESRLIRRNTRYRVKLARGDNSETLELDSNSDDLILREIEDAQGRLVYQIKYEDFKEVDNKRFPHQISIYLRSNGKSVQLGLFGEDLVFDREPFDISTFQIEEP